MQIRSQFKKLRICQLCHIVGLKVEFTNGNKLKQHLRDRHPRTKDQIKKDRVRVNEYRRQQLILAAKLQLHRRD